MEKINGILAGVQAINSTQFKGNKKEIKPNLKQEKDSVTISNKKKKVAIGVALTALAAAAVTAAYLVGRNPKSAAKVLKGTENFADDAYKEGSKIADNILNKEGEFKTSTEKLIKGLRAPEYPTELHEKLSELEKYIKENNIPENSDLVKAARTLKSNLTGYVDDIEAKLLKGEHIDLYDAGLNFGKKNKELSEVISRELGPDSLLGIDFQYMPDTYMASYKNSVKEIPVDLISKDGVFFHGTKKAGVIYKKGFSPFASNQLSKAPRELGAGIYLTSDPEVAGYFSGIEGRIIPLKLAPEAKVAFVGQNSYGSLNREFSKFIEERMGMYNFKSLPEDVRNATWECFIKKAFQKAGYDAAYIPKGVRAGFNLAPDINEFIGKEQKQIVVFSPDKIEITSRNLADRISDVKAKFTAFNRALKYQIKNPTACMLAG